MSLVIAGKVWKFGADVNTDYMAPGFVKNQLSIDAPGG